MKKYLVNFKRSEISNFSHDVLRHEQQRMADLMRDQIMVNVFISKDMNNIWMEFKLNSREDVITIIKTLPMCKDLYFEINEIM